MLMFKYTLSAILTLLITISLQAQKSSKPDKVTFSDGTVESVQIQRTQNYHLGKSINLRMEGESVYRPYSPTVVSEYTFGRNQRTYRAVDVEIPAQKKGGTRVLQRRFGEVLVDGDVQLIRIDLDVDEYEPAAIGIEPYMYLLREGGMELPLELTTIYVYETLNANPSRFRNKLKFFARDCPEGLRYAEDVQFKDSDIMRVVNDYVNCNELENVTINEKKISGRLQLSHFVQASVLDLRDKDYNDRQLSAGIGYQGEAAFTNRMKWFGVLLAAEYVYQSFRWEDQSNVQQSMFKSNLSVAVKPVQREFFEVQLTGGLSNYNATSSSFRSFFNNNYFLLSTGVRVRSHRYLFGLSYEKMPNSVKEQPGNILLLSAGYRIF